jgi:hypothetical protein
MLRIGFGSYPSRVRSALLTRLDGLPSDELFAIPATHTASVYVESSRARDFRDVASVRAGLNHDINPTYQHRPQPGATREHSRFAPQLIPIEDLLSRGGSGRTTISPQNRAGL